MGNISLNLYTLDIRLKYTLDTLKVLLFMVLDPLGHLLRKISDMSIRYTLVRDGDATAFITLYSMSVWLSNLTGKDVSPANALKTAYELNFEVYNS